MEHEVLAVGLRVVNLTATALVLLLMVALRRVWMREDEEHRLLMLGFGGYSFIAAWSSVDALIAQRPVLNTGVYLLTVGALFAVWVMLRVYLKERHRGREH